MKLGGAGRVAQLVVCLTNKHQMLGCLMWLVHSEDLELSLQGLID